VWPSEARSLNEEADDLMRRIADPQTWPDERRQLGSRLTVIQEKMTEMYQRGIITTGAPLRLEEVS
jgi:Trp operon repressor